MHALILLREYKYDLKIFFFYTQYLMDFMNQPFSYTQSTKMIKLINIGFSKFYF